MQLASANYISIFFINHANAFALPGRTIPRFSSLYAGFVEL